MNDWECLDFSVLKQESKNRRKNNREFALKKLTEAGAQFDVKNGGAHIIVFGKDETIDFWPGTGKWVCRKSNVQGRGISGVLKRI